MKRTKDKRKLLIKQADAAMSAYVIRRDGGKCVQCGGSEHMTCGHLLSRRLMSVRYDLENCHAQDWACNVRHSHWPEYYTAWFLQKFGKAKYIKLEQRAHRIKKWSVYELEELLSDLQRKTEELPALIET